MDKNTTVTMSLEDFDELRKAQNQLKIVNTQYNNVSLELGKSLEFDISKYEKRLQEIDEDKSIQSDKAICKAVTEAEKAIVIKIDSSNIIRFIRKYAIIPKYDVNMNNVKFEIT